MKTLHPTFGLPTDDSPAARHTCRIVMTWAFALRWGLLALALAAPLLLWPLPSAAGVPNDKAPPAYAEEQTMLQLEQGLREPGLADKASGIAHGDRHTLVAPGRSGEYGVILQRGGNTWRQLRNGPLAWFAIAVLGLALLTLGGYHLAAGRRHHAPEPGTAPTMQRFTRWQRWVHWTTAIAFVALALSGLVILFGKKLLLPWMGHDVFAVLAIVMKWLHNVSGPLFVLFSLVMFFTFLRHNHFRSVDARWLMRLGGLIGGGHPPAGYFNAGEKLWFWIGVTLLGGLMAASGLVLNFPYLGEVGTLSAFTRYQLQWANVLHLIGATLYLAFALGHIYLGTLAQPESWQAMAHGRVDTRWAREHHRLWVEAVEQGVSDAGQGAEAPRPAAQRPALRAEG